MYDFVENYKKLNDNQQKAIIYLLLGDSNKDVASKIGVDENTIYRWRNNNNFNDVLLDVRLQTLESIEMQLHTLGNKAIDKLSFLLNNADNQNIQLKASTFILDKILQYEQIQLYKRLNLIEERLNIK